MDMINNNSNANIPYLAALVCAKNGYMAFIPDDEMRSAVLKRVFVTSTWKIPYSLDSFLFVLYPYAQTLNVRVYTAVGGGDFLYLRSFAFNEPDLKDKYSLMRVVAGWLSVKSSTVSQANANINGQLSGYSANTQVPITDLNYDNWSSYFAVPWSVVLDAQIEDGIIGCAYPLTQTRFKPADTSDVSTTRSEEISWVWDSIVNAVLFSFAVATSVTAIVIFDTALSPTKLPFQRTWGHFRLSGLVNLNVTGTDVGIRINLAAFRASANPLNGALVSTAVLNVNVFEWKGGAVTADQTVNFELDFWSESELSRVALTVTPLQPAQTATLAYAQVKLTSADADDPGFLSPAIHIAGTGVQVDQVISFDSGVSMEAIPAFTLMEDVKTYPRPPRDPMDLYRIEQLLATGALPMMWELPMWKMCSPNTMSVDRSMIPTSYQAAEWGKWKEKVSRYIKMGAPIVGAAIGGVVGLRRGAPLKGLQSGYAIGKQVGQYFGAEVWPENTSASESRFVVVGSDDESSEEEEEEESTENSGNSVYDSDNEWLPGWEKRVPVKDADFWAYVDWAANEQKNKFKSLQPATKDVEWKGMDNPNRNAPLGVVRINRPPPRRGTDQSPVKAKTNLIDVADPMWQEPKLAQAQSNAMFTLTAHGKSEPMNTQFKKFGGKKCLFARFPVIGPEGGAMMVLFLTTEPARRGMSEIAYDQLTQGGGAILWLDSQVKDFSQEFLGMAQGLMEGSPFPLVFGPVTNLYLSISAGSVSQRSWEAAGMALLALQPCRWPISGTPASVPAADILWQKIGFEPTIVLFPDGTEEQLANVEDALYKIADDYDADITLSSGIGLFMPKMEQPNLYSCMGVNELAATISFLAVTTLTTGVDAVRVQSIQQMNEENRLKNQTLKKEKAKPESGQATQTVTFDGPDKVKQSVTLDFYTTLPKYFMDNEDFANQLYKGVGKAWKQVQGMAWVGEVLSTIEASPKDKGDAIEQLKIYATQTGYDHFFNLVSNIAAFRAAQERKVQKQLTTPALPARGRTIGVFSAMKRKPPSKE